MSPEALRLLERVHGHVAWLAVAALVHPAIVLRNPRRRARLAATLATTLTTVTFGLGAVLYDPYSRRLRRPIYLASRTVGLLFERKEHLAVTAVALAWAGLALHLSRGADPTAETRARAAHLAYVAAAVIAGTVAVLGTRIAAFLSFS